MEIAFLLFVIIAYIAVICGVVYMAFCFLLWLWSGVVFAYEAFYSAFNGMITQQLVSEHFLTLAVALCALSFFLGTRVNRKGIKINKGMKKR